MHHVIIVPGLGDRVGLTIWATNHWRNYGLKPHVYSMDWYSPELSLDTKLNKLASFINQLAEDNNQVSLVGCSAGASAVLNVFLEHRDKINKVVSICGRLRDGKHQGFHSLKTRSKSSPTFAQSVQLFESRESLLSEKDRSRVMTVRALWDEL